MNAIQNIENFLSELSIDHVLSSRRKEWEKDFDTNKEALIDNIIGSISKKIFSTMTNVALDNYKRLPCKDKPYVLNFHFDISTDRGRESLRRWGGEAANLPPFKSWLDSNIAGDNDACSNSFFANHQPVHLAKANEFEDDVRYFNEKMSSIVETVAYNLNQLTKLCSAQPKCSQAKFNVTYLPDQKNNDSANVIKVKFWFSDKATDETNEKTTTSQDSIEVKPQGYLFKCNIL